MSQPTNELARIGELLGRLWLHEADLETLVAMGKDSFRVPYEELGGFVPETVDQDVVESLAVEYCEVLIGPKGQISPVQSVWVGDQLQSETASSMSRFFELLPGYESPSSLTDHVGVQLDFVSKLLKQDNNVADEIVAAFFQSHLNWTSQFFDRVTQATRSEFYRGLAKVSKAMVQEVFRPVGDLR